MHAVALWGCMDTVTVKESALKIELGKKNKKLATRGPKLASVLHLAFQPDALLSKVNILLTSTEARMLIRDGDREGKGVRE